MSTNGYEIRLELLKMAKEMLEQDWHGQREMALTRFNNQVSVAHSRAEKDGWDNTAFPELPPIKPFPSEAEIIAKARVLNEFINQKY